MYLKSLTIRGFKSFADKTELKFEPGLTAVVGPNGSGKSNITDAVLWVLGEQSPTSLRGSSMEDIIFSGGPNRQALGLAEVSVVFDNVDKILPLEYSEVSISRRVSRSGESGYFINGVPARLFDIQDLLSDSGIGRETHTIISQGRIDQVLSSRPEEVRMMIEEAAGLLKYRKRKEKTLRKLERLEQDMLRLGDIERELRRQLRPLQEQAERAKTHEEASDALKSLEVGLAVYQLSDFQKQWEKSDSRFKDLGRLGSLLQGMIASIATETRDLEAEATRAGGDTETARNRQHEIERMQEQISSLDVLLKERKRLYLEKANAAEALHQQQLNREALAQSRAKEFLIEDDTVRQELERVRQETELLQKIIDEAATRADELSAKINENQESMEKHRSAAHTQNQALILAQAELTEIQSQQAILKARDKTIIGRIEEYENQIEERSRHQSDAVRATDDLATLLNGCQERQRCPGADKADGLKEMWQSIGENEIQGLLKLKNRWEEQKAKLQTKLVEIDGQLMIVQQKKSGLADEARQLEARIVENRHDLEKLRLDKESLEQEKAKKSQERQELLVKAASLIERQKSVRGQLASINDSDNGGIGLSANAREIEALRRKAGFIERLQDRVLLLDEFAAAIAKRAGKECSSNVSAYSDYQKRIDSLNSDTADTNILLNDIRENLHTIEMQRSQLELQVSTIVSKIVDDYDVPLEHAVRDHEARVNPHEAGEEIKKLKRRLASLGLVNPIAVEEFNALQERYDVLSGQISDLKKSRRDLSRIIEEIDNKIKSTFSETFSEVNEHFNSIVAFLFDGGYGKLTLLDNEDVLESGVEIEVKPGKKKKQKLTLLSGGERALAAIALLFALYETRPSPFYILDEVEAALDDINLSRFASLLDKYRDKTQFLIITHQKRTMEMANALYGISMKQDGTSRLISQKLNERGASDEVSMAWEE